MVTAYISIAQLRTGKNALTLSSVPSLDDTCQNELTTIDELQLNEATSTLK